MKQLGFKEYEAECFVGLSRLGKGSAREISEISEVPRTRVYDAVRVLEMKGLVEVQHSTPQQFRAVDIDQTIEILRNEYDSKLDRLCEALQGLELVQSDDATEVEHEVWSISGDDSITSRMKHLIDTAEDEVVLVIGDVEM
ncbi:MAG: helix-turn-helix domain-containing protein, partial [Halobacteria archaeon]|nr:helix-turn-helix domain-containing protein [Halobacteria archaeon]